MADGTKIEWTDATWNPITGCTVLSAGCTNCYAMKLAGTRMKHHASRAGLTIDTKAGPVWNGVVRFNDQWLRQPLQWQKPREIFVNAHGDTFHHGAPDDWIDQIFAVAALAPHHIFQVLTKRSNRMLAYLTDPETPGRIAGHMAELSGRSGIVQWPLPNVWLGVSVEDQRSADERVPDLLETPAAVRWLSCEPLLGPVDLTTIEMPDERAGKYAGHGYTFNALRQMDDLTLFNAPAHIDWVVAGGESDKGDRARPMHRLWAEALAHQCGDAEVAFLFKQWGDWVPLSHPGEGHWPTDKGGCIRLDRFGNRTDDGEPMQRVGKKHAGRQLLGRHWDDRPAYEQEVVF